MHTHNARYFQSPAIDVGDIHRHCVNPFISKRMPLWDVTNKSVGRVSISDTGNSQYLLYFLTTVLLPQSD